MTVIKNAQGAVSAKRQLRGALLDYLPRRNSLVGRNVAAVSGRPLERWGERDAARYPKLLINIKDAMQLGIDEGDPVILSSANGSITVPAEPTASIMRKVICYPHGWGHRDCGLNHAKESPGENYNELTSTDGLCPVSGMPRLNGIRVTIEKAT